MLRTVCAAGAPSWLIASTTTCFERMHYLCFHLEFEHSDCEPDEGCDVPGCPVAETHANYLRDLRTELRAQAFAARTSARQNRDDGSAERVSHGYHVVVSLMLQQANAFRIPPAILRPEGLDPESDLL
jgi:hypothetical protein